MNERKSYLPRPALNRPAQQKNKGGMALRPNSLPATHFGQQVTLRQNHIVAMLNIGSSNSEIPHMLGLSEGTIKLHLHLIGASNRTQLTAQSFAADAANWLISNLSVVNYRKISLTLRGIFALLFAVFSAWGQQCAPDLAILRSQFSWDVLRASILLRSPLPISV